MKPTPSRGHSQSQPEPLEESSSDTHQQEIVLLEDGDLYRYDHRQQPSDVESIPIAQPSRVQSQQQQLQRQTTARTTGSFYSSDYSSDYDQSSGSRQYQLHATPFAISSVRKPSLTSVDTISISHGALRPGVPVDLFSRHYIGLLLNWALVGFFNGSLSGLAYPFFEVYLGYADAQLNAASSLIDMPWLFKFAAGFITDCFSINRQRRKPYILIGWTAFMLFMFAMSFMTEPRPMKKNSPNEYPEAPSQGSKYVISIIVGSMGHLLATVAVEGAMVEFAQREGEFVRGRTQAWCMIARFSGEALGALAIALALNSPTFGGSFAAAVPLRVFFGVHAILAALGLVLTKCFFHEELATVGSQRLATHVRRIGSIMQKKTTWQITIFGSLIKLATNYEIQEHNSLFRRWLGADTLTLNMSDAIRSVGYMVAAVIFMRFLLNTNWRQLMVSVMALGLVAMAPVDMITVFDVYRSLPLFLTKVQITSVLDAFLFILRLALIIEVAEPGYEAVTYGILTTVFNLGGMIVSMTKNVVATGWSKDITDLKLDSAAVRWHVTYQFLVKYGLRVVAVVLLVKLLPRQKRHLKERNLHGRSTLMIPIALFVLFAALFCVSVTSNMLALFGSTSCLILAGGNGC